MTTRYWRIAATVLILLLGGLTTSADAAQTWRFRLEEATIADIHRAIRGLEAPRHLALDEALGNAEAIAAVLGAARGGT